MESTAPGTQRPRVVVIGAGFGGLSVVRGLARAPVDVLLIDRTNYHAFWPLLYQVATAGLEPQQIAQPVRAILRRIPNARFRVATAQSVDLARQVVISDIGALPYDELIVSAGSATNYFGLKHIETESYGLKEIPEALALRNHIITSFEHAAVESDPDRLRRLLTFVVVGGGPTGVELAGAISELIRHVMHKDYPGLDFSHVRVLLLEMLDRLLPAFPENLARKAQRRLEKLDVEVLLGAQVADLQNEVLHLKDGTEIPARTVVWAAGVQGAALAEALGLELKRGLRVPVTPELQLPQYPNVWVLGDMAYLEGPDGRPYPQLAAVAMQQGRLVADNLRCKLRGQPLRPFHYVDKGSMATVGRNFAVARIWGINWSGFIAWLLWLGVHLLYLAGLRNRALVLLNWAYNYVTYDRAARAVIAPAVHPHAAEEPATVSAQPESELLTRTED